MGSSKKERGKQRKAERKQGQSDSSVSPITIVKLIQSGDDFMTRYYCSGRCNISRDKVGMILSSVLGFLRRCENESFKDVLAPLSGDLECPSMWINVLYHVGTLQPSYNLQIAQNIGPLVKCMCEDVKRLFFQNNKHWFDTIRLFSGLVLNIISKAKSEVIGALLQHEGLLRSIAQWRFWNEENRPDILDELDVDACAIVNRCGRRCTTLLVAAATNPREVIGSTPVVNKDYRPKGWIDSFVSGLINQMTNDDEYDEDDESTLRHLIEGADCVDGCIIADMIHYGLKSGDYYEDAKLSVELVCTMLKKGTAVTNVPSDTRVAFAIRASLIDMCLGLIEKFGCRGDDATKTLFLHIENTCKTIHEVALHKKTWKAIRRMNIGEKLEQLKAIITHDSGKKLLDMIKSIIDINGAYCCHCNKSLGRKERKQCGGCNLMTYCSKTCQKQDWLKGHNRACCKSFSIKTPGQFQGRILPETIPDDERAAAKLQELEINNNMIQLKLFRDHSATIVAQAKLLNIPICDCIVTFDLRHCPPLLKIGSKKDVGDDTSWTKNITCMFISPNFCEGDESKLVMQRWFFPIDF